MGELDLAYGQAPIGLCQGRRLRLSTRHWQSIRVDPIVLRSISIPWDNVMIDRPHSIRARHRRADDNPSNMAMMVRPPPTEIANSVEAVQGGRIYIELINAPMLFEHEATRQMQRQAQAAGDRHLREVRASGRGPVRKSQQQGTNRPFAS
jgi:hypothetical protein